MLQVHPCLCQPHLRLGRPNPPTPCPHVSRPSRHVWCHRLCSSSTHHYAPFLLLHSRSPSTTHPLASLALAFRLRATRRGGIPLAHASLKAAPMPTRAARPDVPPAPWPLFTCPDVFRPPTARTQDGPDASDMPQTLPTRPCRLRPCHLHGPTSLSPVSQLRLAHSLHQPPSCLRLISPHPRAPSVPFNTAAPQPSIQSTPMLSVLAHAVV